jgi:hypothetical protein
VKRLAWLVVLAACATARAPVVGDPGPVSSDPSEENVWLQTLDNYTDRKSIYDGLDTRLFVAGTWQSPRFAEARVKRESEFHGLPLAEAVAAWEAERTRLSDITEIELGVHLNDSHYEDFDKRNSIWRLTLVGGGVEVAPLEIRRRGKATLARRAIYPYLDTFWVEYVVRFPKVQVGPGQKFTLRIASSLGRAELEFKAE